MFKVINTFFDEQTSNALLILHCTTIEIRATC